MHKIIRIFISGIVIIMLINSLCFVSMASYKSIHAYILLAEGKLDERPGIHIAESLDGFMLALFFIIFSMGITKLFMPSANFLGKYDLPWLKVENFSQLKYIMWEVLITTILVFFANRLIILDTALEWQILIFPTSILMLAFAFKLLKSGH